MILLAMKEEFTEETLRYVSGLCRIRCTEEETKELSSSINKILSHIEHLQEVNTEGFEPVYTVIEQRKNVLREDISARTLSREDFLNNSPEHIGGMIRVPKVFS